VSPITHAEISWLIANIPKSIKRKERGLILLAGTIPDLDGIGIIFNTELYVKYHHILFHNVLFGTIISLLFTSLRSRNRVLMMVFYLAVFHIHILCDLLGSGPDWPIAYLWPFSNKLYHFKYQWNLVSWQNFVTTLIATFLLFFVAVRCRRTPLELISRRIDRKVVATIQWRWHRIKQILFSKTLYFYGWTL
jgi:inner membrane protein